MRKITFTPTLILDIRILSKPLLLTLFLLFTYGFSFATDYYFSSSIGNDNRSNAEAQNPATPWKSIDKLNSIGPTLKAGDRIYFKSGDTFYGTIKLSVSGGTGNPITFSSFGTGTKPVITSQVTIQNFTSIGNGLYQADLSPYNLSKIQVVLLNNQIKEIGRYPNSDASNGGYLKIGSVQSKTSFTSTTGNPISGSTGEVVVRKNNWIIDRHKINYIGGSSISYQDISSQYPPQAGFGYFLQNHPSLLDKPGEWSYDAGSKKFTINLSGYNIAGTSVSVSTLQNLVSNNPYTNNFKFSNLHFKGSNSHLFELSRSQNINIENSILEFAGENAINASDVQGLIIRNNQILSTLNNGIHLTYGAPGAIIENNVIDKAMLFQGMAKSSDLAGIAIFVSSDSDNTIVRKNTITNVGFNAIHFGGNYTKIINNFIDTFCLYKQDGGGIYNNSDGLTGRNNTGREIVGNIILNGRGTKNGTIEEVDMAEGIYLDDNSAGIKIADNTIAFMTGKGIYLHNANNIQVQNNIFYRSKVQLQLTHDYYGDPNRNITISGNQYSTVDKLEKIYSAYSVIDDIGSVGSINNNYFLDPFSIDFFIHTRSASDPAVGINRNLGNWKNSFGYDVSSIKPALNLTTTKVISSNKIKESNFSSGGSIISGLYNASSKILSSGISGSTLAIYPNGSNSATAYIQLGSVSTNDKIMVEFDMKGTPDNKAIEWFLEETYNYDKGVGNKFTSTTSGVSHFQVFLDAKVSKSNESIVIRIPNTAQEVMIDNLVISKVQTEELPIENFVVFKYNNSASTIQYPLDGTYKNGKNQQFVGSVSIPPFSSVVLAKISEDGATQANQAPTVSISSPFQNQQFNFGVDPVQLVANASDPEGKVKSVEFYNWGNLIQTVTAAPYVFNWNSIEIGNYQIHAKVTDVDGLTAESTKVNFSVVEQAQRPPSYTALLTSPSNNATYKKGVDPVILKTNATTSGLSIQKVEYFNWGFPVITITSAPFEHNWSTILPDNYKVHAQVTDASGNVYKTNEISFKVIENTVPAYTPPTVSMGSPTNGQVFTLGSDLVSLKAIVSDPSKVKSLQYYNWGFPLVSANSYPFQFDWTKIEVGEYKVHIELIDINGNLIKSDPVKFTVKANTNNTLNQTVRMASPYNGQQFEFGKDLVSLIASTDIVATKVEFFNWGFPLVTAPTSTKRFDWTKIEVGDYSVFARITDVNGKIYDSELVKFRVNASNARINSSPLTESSKTTSNSLSELNLESGSQVEKLDDSSIYGIKMGPNPAQEQVTLFFQDYPQNLKGTIHIIDMRGIQIQSKEFNTNDGQVEMDIASLPQGIYIVRLDFGSVGIQSKKLIKN